MAVYMNFVTLFAALLEVKEKRAPCFRQKSNLDLLKACPLPQDRSQLYLAGSLCKRIHSDYVPMSEQVTLIPLQNVTKLYAGKERPPLTKVVYSQNKCLSPSSTFELTTDLQTYPKLDIDDDHFLSLYTT